MSKKLIKAIAIIAMLSIIIMISNILNNSTVSATTHGFYTRGKNGSLSSTQITNWSGVNTVYVDQTGNYANQYYLTLNQHNVFCVQHGTTVKNTWYSVSNEYTVSDPGLAYILYNGSKGTGLESSWGEDYNEWQWKLWAYLYDNRDKDGDFATIIGGKAITDKNESYSDVTTYVNKIKNFKPSVSISEYNDTQLEISVSGCEGSYTFKYRGDDAESYTSTTKSDSTFRLSKGSFGKIDVQVSDTIERYTVKYRILSHATGQRILVVTESGTTNETRQDSDSWIGNTNISLQKYIIKVNDEDLTTAQTKETQRKLMMTKDGEANTGVKVGIIPGANANETLFKYDEFVTIGQGDTVTYRISVYNNSNITARNIVIHDWLTSYTDDNGTVKTYGIFKSVKRGDVNGNIYDQNVTTSKVNDNTIGWTLDKLEGGERAYYYVTVQYNKYNPNRMTNSASIHSTIPTNEATYRTVDRDYVKMPSNTNVSLQKYIIKVNDEDLTTAQTELTDRRITMTRKDESNDGVAVEVKPNINANTNEFKYEKPVTICQGDTVTYRISVYNNSTITANEIVIRDMLTCYTDDDGKKKPYGEVKSVKLGSIDGDNIAYRTLENNEYNDHPTIEWTLTNLRRGETAYCYVTVQYNKYYSNRMSNSAWIYKTTPTNNTTYRTVDRDYVKMPIYSVSLEKYVSAVNGSSSIDPAKARLGHPIYNQNNYSKEQNPVKVEIGDTVTYTIKLTNTGTGGIKNLKITDVCPEGLTYKECSTNVTKSGNTFTYTGTIAAEAPATFTITYTVNGGTGGKVKNIENEATVSTSFNNIQGKSVTDSDGEENNTDKDWVETKIYKVSLQKIVYSVNNRIEGISSFDRWTSWESTEKNDKKKYNNPVVVSNGDEVTYAIKVRNDGDTKVKVTKIRDILPEGLKLVNVKNIKGTILGELTSYSADGHQFIIDGGPIENEKCTPVGAYMYDEDKRTVHIFPEHVNQEDRLLPINGGEDIYYVTVKVTEPNMSVEVLRNWADIRWIRNRNESVYTVDSTSSNNSDADYIQLNPGGDSGTESIISGTVWNDKALNKTQDNYNGTFDDGSENKLSGITVKLYRKGVSEAIATDITDADGKYSFADNDISSEVVTNSWERYIKGPRTSGTTRWAGTYYSYYIVFEYDGITYTSTTFADVTSTNSLDSNAKEDNSNGKSGLTTRTNFNNKFSTVNSDSGINYITNNQSGYIPQSIYQYNSNMAMQSSTDLIELSINTNLEQLQHVNLGLRGRDIFDLELTSDVSEIEVKVNNQIGVYKYSNKVTLRKSDLKATSTTTEDMANIAREDSNTYVDSYNQNIRQTDLDLTKTNANGAAYSSENGLQSIFVTYKITVQNTSRTDGNATKITNYYDSKYTFVGAYASKEDIKNDKKLSIDNNLSKDPTGSDKYGYKTVITNWPAITQAGTKDIYVVYTLNNPSNTLKDIESLPTYNMSEISEYTTKCASGQTEYTRGLIDKDSAPGSANKEQVRLVSTQSQNTSTTNGDPTTVKYYFAGNNLSDLKYEDDTYATPTLYFVKDENQRTIAGTVFEDLTKINPTTKIKTGNGKLDDGEVGVYGATVELVEGGSNGTIRYSKTTDQNGNFKFEGFLPGNYIIRYIYGNNHDTVLINEHNAKSYNGEDFQATNNAYDIEGMDTNILNKTTNYWYVYNEDDGISTAFDNGDRRFTVSGNVTNFTDEQMTVLNNMRKGKNTEDAKVLYNETEVTVDNIIDATYMWAETEPMLLTVEKTELVKDSDGKVTGTAQRTTFGEYKITNMNFGIAEVPVSIVDLQKHVKGFTLKDSTGQNVIASISRKEDGNWEIIGDVLTDLNGRIDVSIENEKLQGARLEVTYTISTNINAEVNFDGNACVVPQISGVADFINNNLSYNSQLGDNDKYWKVTTFENLSNFMGNQQYKEGSKPVGTVDPEGATYTTVLMATYANPLIGAVDGESSVDITLEKVLSSTDLTIEDIITSTIDTSEYSNIVEIIGFKYLDTKPENPKEEFVPDGVSPQEVPQSEDTPDPDTMRDRVRTPDGDTIIPAVDNDYAISETIVIHPPTGTTQIDIVYYIVTVIALGVLAVGVFGIKKFVIKK